MASSAYTYARGASPPRRTDNLAFLFQETLTVIVRLRARRQNVTNPDEFRRDITGWLRDATKEAVSRGYSTDDVRFAAYAVVALLDETVLNSNDPIFANWISNPLQTQLFGNLLAGENYFRNLEVLLSRQDSQELADVLEVVLLCLLLGFRGRHGKEIDTPQAFSGGQGFTGIFGAGASPGLAARSSMHGLREAIRDKIRRIRGADPGFLAASAAPLPEPAVTATSPWRRGFLWAAVTSWVLAVLLFVGFKVVLLNKAGDIPAPPIAVQP